MKILILCTGNSCRSIIAEAILRSMGHEAKSAGSKPTGRVNENAKRLLKERGLWSEDLHSKPIDAVMNEEFDLVITVCDNAKESCPTFGPKTKTLHIPFEDPDGKPYGEFKKLFEQMRRRLSEEIAPAG
ncbi:MAG: arsenate reductase ArsC [Epsilonproteobacteria bacterium]|nr:arsenate reductase ArsC [Campylobacterota bacterium]